MAWRHEIHEAESSRIVERDDRAGRHVEDHVIVTAGARPDSHLRMPIVPGVEGDAKGARHAEVHQQRLARGQRGEQVLRPPGQRQDRPAAEPRNELRGERDAQVGTTDDDSIEARAAHDRFELTSNRLDFRKLRQGPSFRSSLGSPVEHRFHVDDRRTVDGFQVAHAHARAVNLENRDPVQPDRVRPVRRARAEHALKRVGGVSPRMDDQHVAPRTIEPRQHDDLVTDPQVPQPFADPVLERQPGLRRSLVPLPGCRGAILRAATRPTRSAAARSAARSTHSPRHCGRSRWPPRVLEGSSAPDLTGAIGLIQAP